MGKILQIDMRNRVLLSMAQLVRDHAKEILAANEADIRGYEGEDISMYDRLKLDPEKVRAMAQSLEYLAAQPDPLGRERYRFAHENGMEISDRTAPFGTVLIIYESRPDVTVEAGGIAFKSGTRILLKGGREALQSNLCLTRLWQQALEARGADSGWITYLDFTREETRAFLERPPEKIDLVVPRGGETLISFVRQHARCPVIVSGRGNNFLFVDREADPGMAREIIINAKTTKISACNALDKVLIDRELPEFDTFVRTLMDELASHKVNILTDDRLSHHPGATRLTDKAIWFEEFLDYKILIAQVKDLEEAIGVINTYSGGHSASIVSGNAAKANRFMDEVDAAAVYHNTTTRFTDGGQFGLGGELAISTDKLHQRGPLGLTHLTTNKWYIKGSGQLRP